MKLIVGLGNPGRQYETTRHNAGFLVIDELVRRYEGTVFLMHSKFDAMLSNGMIGKRQVIYMKPQTYMNKSGGPVSRLAAYYDISPSDILVLHDDIDRETMTTKLKYSGSHGGHNGVRDLINRLGTPQFWRLKLGVGRPSHPGADIVGHVLGKMSGEELAYWSGPHMTHEIMEKVEAWLKNTG